MKNILAIVFAFASTLFTSAQAQTAGVPDTLAYLQSIVANKSQFIGQPFSKLSDSLKIQIKYFSPFGGIHYDKSKETSTSFSFYFPQTMDEFYRTYPHLEVYWQPYLNNTQAIALFNQHDGGWVPAVIGYYSTGIIADIKLRTE